MGDSTSAGKMGSVREEPTVETSGPHTSTCAQVDSYTCEHTHTGNTQHIYF